MGLCFSSPLPIESRKSREYRVRPYNDKNLQGREQVILVRKTNIKHSRLRQRPLSPYPRPSDPKIQRYTKGAPFHLKYNEGRRGKKITKIRVRNPNEMRMSSRNEDRSLNRQKQKQNQKIARRQIRSKET